MQERDAFAVGTDAGDLVDQLDPCATAAVERGTEIVDGKTDVMNARTTFGDELADGRGGIIGLEQLDEGVAGTKASDARAVGVVERFFGKSEQVAIEGEYAVECVDSNADVRDPGAHRLTIYSRGTREHGR